MTRHPMATAMQPVLEPARSCIADIRRHGHDPHHGSFYVGVLMAARLLQMAELLEADGGAYPGFRVTVPTTARPLHRVHWYTVSGSLVSDVIGYLDDIAVRVRGALGPCEIKLVSDSTAREFDAKGWR